MIRKIYKGIKSSIDCQELTRCRGMNCPRCQSGDNVYMNGKDPVIGPYVLCSVHGAQVVKKDEHKEDIKP